MVALVNKYGKISTSASAQIAASKKWNMALVRDSANMDVLIFAGDKTIAPGATYGPYALLEGKASFVLSGGSNAHLRGSLYLIDFYLILFWARMLLFLLTDFCYSRYASHSSMDRSKRTECTLVDNGLYQSLLWPLEARRLPFGHICVPLWK